MVTLRTVTCEARSKISRSILAPGVPTMRSGLPVRQRTTISRYRRGRSTIVPPRPRSARTAVSKLAAPVTRTVDERDAAWVPATASDVTTRSETTTAARATPALRDRNTVTTLSRTREEPPRHPEPE
jgi:hypothetical protein